MAKIKASIGKLSGKMNDKVFVDGKYGGYMRDAPVKGRKKGEAALKKQYMRTEFLNSLASELNTIISRYSDNLKSKDFYHRVQKRFRKEPQNNRLLLLWQLKEMEINNAYQLEKLGYANVAVQAVRKKMIVHLHVPVHPKIDTHKFNCYQFQIVFLNWNKSKKKASHARQYSEWVSVDGGRPEFEFEFPKQPGIKHWLLCLRLQLGYNEKTNGALSTQGMQIVAVGTMDKKEAALLSKQDQQPKQPETGVNTNVDDVVRVKAKRFL